MLWAICNTLAKRPSGLELIKAGTPHRKGYTSKTEEIADYYTRLEKMERKAKEEHAQN